MNVVKVLMDLVGFMKNSRLTETQMKELQNWHHGRTVGQLTALHFSHD